MVFPHRFGSLDDARTFLAAFVEYYNTMHRHSGIGLHTPGSVHSGTWKAIDAHRQATLDRARTDHPDRFRAGRPTTPKLPPGGLDQQTISRNRIYTDKAA